MAGKHCPSAGVLPALLIAILLGALAVGGCGEDNPPTAPVYLEQSSPGNVLLNLQTAWRQRDYARYSGLLADDYQFYFDEATRTRHGLPVFWTRLDDSAEVCGVFNDPDITAIRIELQYGPPVPVPTMGRDNWVYVNVTGGFVEVDCGFTPAHPQARTRRFEVGSQKIYLRPGRTQADADRIAPETARPWYIVEWDDLSGSPGIWPGDRDSLRCQP